MLDLQNTYIKKMIYYIINNATIEDLQNIVGIIRDDQDDESDSYT